MMPGTRSSAERACKVMLNGRMSVCACYLRESASSARR